MLCVTIFIIDFFINIDKNVSSIIISILFFSNENTISNCNISLPLSQSEPISSPTPTKYLNIIFYKFCMFVFLIYILFF